MEASQRFGPRLLVIAQGPVLQWGLRDLLNAAGGVAEFSDLTSPPLLLTLLDEHPPDVLLIDAQLPNSSAFHLCHHVRTVRPHIPVLLLTNLDWDREVGLACWAGATGLVMKNASVEEFIGTLKRALGREEAFTPAQRVKAQNWERSVGAPLRSLSQREHQVLRMLVDAKHNTEIAVALGISENTVENHVSSILTKLQVSSRTELLAFLLRHHVEFLA